MTVKFFVSVLAVSTLLSEFALAQEENPDFRIRAEFRDNTDESVGNATVKVISRFMQVYYGGVRRSDEYRFQLSLESMQFANKSIDVKVDDFFVGTHAPNASGYLDVTYRSDFKPDDFPDLPLPVGFPDPIDVGNVVRLIDHTTNELLLSSVFGEEFPRGDADHDYDVDAADYEVWRSHHGQSGVGPAVGDYSGDNRADSADYVIWRKNYSGSASGTGVSPAAIPEPSAILLLTTVVCYVATFRRSRHEHH